MLELKVLLCLVAATPAPSLCFRAFVAMSAGASAIAAAREASAPGAASAQGLASAANEAPAPAPTASLAEKARSQFSSGGIQFIPVELLGTVPCNRSGLGVSGFHVHEVALSIKADGLSKRRYRDASVVKVPPSELDSFRAFNKRMCESDDLLPPFSPAMRYACLTKNHFVHALKLYRSGSTLLHGTRELIKPNPADKQLEQHLSEGVACEVLREELWGEDPKGLEAIVGEDNMDAAVEMAASEIEVLQALRRMLDDTKGEKDPNKRFRMVMNQAKARFGTQAYSEGDMVNLFNFAVRVPTALVDNLCQVHFAVIPGALLRVRPLEFGHLAKLDKAHPYVKVALAISMYFGAIASGGGALRRQSGGVAAFAPGVKKDVLEKMGLDRLQAAETFLTAVLKHYKVNMETVYSKALLHARGKLFHRAGQLLQKWPGTEVAVQQAWAKIEEKYAVELLECRGVAERPPKRYLAPQVVKTVGGEAGKKEAKKKPETPGSTIFAEEDPAEPSPGPASAADAASASASSAASASAPIVAIAKVLAYKVPAEGMRSVEQEAWEAYPRLLWRRLAQQGLVQILMKHKASATGVEVSVLEASEPLVYQARALKAFPAGNLVLAPFVSTELVDFSDGAKLKRPKTLHPHLPFAVECQAGAFELDDTASFFLKSPLASGAAIPQKLACPFWAVLQAQAASDANMKVVPLRTAWPSTTFALGGPEAPTKGRGKRAKPTPLTVAVPALVNTKAVARGEVLVFTGSLTLDPPAEGDEEADE